MWEQAPIAPEDPLRQGDLLVEIRFPTLKHPLPAVPEEHGQSSRNVVLPYARETALVVSQCCSTGDQYVALAPVRPLTGMTSVQEAGLLLEEPPHSDETDGPKYMMDSFALGPVTDVLEELPAGRYHVADLGRILSFRGKTCGAMAAQRRARLTVAARRLLRIKLALFWARPEQGDAEELERLGLPVGIRQD